MRIALVNTNRLIPPIAPIGLDYVSQALRAAGHEVALLDLCWADDWPAAVSAFFGATEVQLVGLTLRNTDDCMLSGCRSYVDEFAAMVDHVRRHAGAPLVVGGVGFSVMPRLVLAHCGADWGVHGDGEQPLVELAGRLERGQAWSDVPGLVWPEPSGWRANPPGGWRLDILPPMRRDGVDNPRYFRQGGQVGFETRRGCPGACIYCADPLARGSMVRLRPAPAVADEVEALVSQGITHLHTCDGEFNLPVEHARAVCRELIRRGLGERIRWYAYCAPAPFPADLAALMRQAGCAGVNFGADSGDAEMLRRLGRGFGPEAIARAVEACRQAGLATMLDLLLGGPGETQASLRTTIEFVRRVRPDRAGVSLGVRVYPGTELARQVARQTGGAGLLGGPDPVRPLYYLDPAVAPFASELLGRLIGGDPLFFYAPAGADRDYNYSDNQVLVQAIARGYRGAYWDILRRLAEGLPA
ncbi:MAG: radical SAM protein [Candidatus Latescibacterota bacterium]